MVICGNAATFWKYRNHGLDAEVDVSACLLVGLGDMERTDQRPVLAVDLGAEGGGALLDDAPVVRRARRIRPRSSVAPIDSRPMPCLPASRAPVGEATAATASGMPPSEYGASCSWASNSSWVAVLAVTVSPASSRTTMSRLVSSSSRVSVGVSPIIAESVGSEPGPTPPIIRPWVRWSSSISRSADPQRVVVRQRDDAGAEPDPLGALRGRGDENLWRTDDLAARRVVLADPHLVEAEPVEVFDELEVALQRKRRVGACAMKRRDEVSESELGHA